MSPLMLMSTIAGTIPQPDGMNCVLVAMDRLTGAGKTSFSVAMAATDQLKELQCL